MLYKELSYRIIGLAMEVHRELGYGFLEKVYENALVILLKENNIKIEQQKQIIIEFHKKEIGNYISDLLIEDKIIVELKVATQIKEVHKAQVANYLKATNKKLGIILNFGKEKLKFERVVM
ncbi:GxxExxY protein [Psychrilyobacter piezotolerans]|uniref:GxxExxY protein n=1 Tax=Psychrilyobacter piezotolerans TaxID=2293438 RepID=A0ABX9KDT4_9FUSO|nr:GxxExxY protein [Psychrilyobacter piezotolerans]RDE59179.1 GxxExxY protein [Psychrilyobacter sp. S5]REI39741.1 GxxExxY protein [Psychrilyobacter piezotolerans]